MKKIFQFIAVTSLGMLTTCSPARKTYVSYFDWDSNHNSQIERSEFVDAYIRQDYFDKWGAGRNNITYWELFTEAFSAMDTDRDGKLSIVEFNSHIRPIYFGLFDGSFQRWDDDSNASISKLEFDKHVSATNLGNLWDTDDNKHIARREMAGGMFYICDANSDGTVDATELNEWRRNR